MYIDNCRAGIQDEPSVQLYPRRFAILVVFCITGFINQYQWICYAPVPNITSRTYDVSYGFVNLLSLTFYIAYVILIIPTFWCFSRFGFRKMMLVSAALNFIGASLKLLGYSQRNAYWLMIAQIICAISQLPILGTPPFLAALWFGEHERATATGVAFMCLNLGIAASMLMQPAIVKEGNTPVATFYPSFIFQIGVTAFVLIATLFIVHDRPPKPPCATSSEAVTQKESILDTLHQWGVILYNLPFLILLISFSCTMGNFWAFTTVFAEVLCPFGYSNQVMGAMAATNVFAGIVATLAVGAALDKWRKTGSRHFSYRIPLAAFGAIAAVVLVIFIIILKRDGGSNPVGLAVLYGLFGALQNATIPAALELGVELTYPASEAHVGGTMMGFANLTGIALVLVYTRVIQGSLNFGAGGETCDTSAQQQDRSVVTIIITTAITAVAALAAALAAGKLQRFELERKRAEHIGASPDLEGK
eukprot:TRINITY_DN49014_c0_g1_i2.p1 TRINITY_DN49014_c0_g1~~TRINITY_DN49014_c0_g1_i2.p1  ORF type:complete len:476 (-),score=35.90 TRINITY_DN49014_c0_g1_i2:689-2116(-)